MTARAWLSRHRRGAIIAAVIVIAAAIFFELRRTELADYSSIVLTRYQRAQKADVLEIATIWGKNPSLAIGARVAAAELNNAGSVTTPAGRRVKIAVTSFEVDPGDETREARRIARDTRYVAVIGHTTSDTANLSSISYQETNLLFLAVNATDPVLTTRDGFHFIFRTSPTDDDFIDLFASALDAIAPQTRGRIGVLYTRSAHYAMSSYLDELRGALGRRSLTPAFEKPYAMRLAPPEKGLLVRLSGGRFGFGSRWLRYLQASDELRNTVSRMYDDKTPLDAVIVLDDNPANADIATRRVRRTMPEAETTVMLGGLGLDHGERPQPAAQCFDLSLPADVARLRAGLATAPPNVQSMLIVTTLCPVTPAIDALMQRLDVERRAEGAGARLDYAAAWQGYRAVKIVAEAAQRADSIAPVDLAAQLRSGMSLSSAEGASFARNGDLEGQKIYVKLLQFARGAARTAKPSDKPRG